MDVRNHEWDLLEQSRPHIPKPFGFVCACGAVVAEGFSTWREAVRAARSHARTSSARPAA